MVAVRVLVVSPHPDDEALGCGGSIAADVAAGCEVVIAHLTSGEHGGSRPPSGLGPMREQEALAAAEALGVPTPNVKLLRFGDGRLNPYDFDQFGAVVRLIRDVRPDRLYIPHPDDGAFDHEAAHILCWRAAGMAASRNFPDWGGPHWVPVVLGYEVWTPIHAPAFLRDVTDQVAAKLSALECYRSQSPAGKGPGQATHVGPVAWLSGFRGATTTGGYREAFAVLRLGETP